jgi:hypothetical protein
VSRRVVFAVVLYLTLDFCLPSMPGAFQFDPGHSVESVGASRAVQTVTAAVVQRPCTPDRQVSLATTVALRRTSARTVATPVVPLRRVSGHRAVAAEPAPPPEDAG